MKNYFLLSLTTLLMISAGCSLSIIPRDKLIIYTNSGDSGRSEWLTKEAKKWI